MSGAARPTSTPEGGPTRGPGFHAARAASPTQLALDDLGQPLSGTTFVVADLETTGTSPQDCEITEIGAVKVRGGDVLGEFQTLVRPEVPIPAFVAVLTGITDTMVAGAPRISAVLPSFLSFLGDAVLVAHNAPFDVGFLRAACSRTGRTWPRPVVLDTVRLARQILTRDEAPDVRLATLARVLRSTVTPDHRALTDARATVDVLHALLERVGNRGVHTLQDLQAWQVRLTPAQRSKRTWADDVPAAAGVYLFRDARERVLYVGTSRDLRTRVRSYFTAGETRRRIAEMLAVAQRVESIVCATDLEARVRELRLIAAHAPPYNRRSKYPERQHWVKVTVEPFPRLSLVHTVRDDGATYLGPFGSAAAAARVVDALHEATMLRQCTRRLSVRRPSPACVLADLGRCGAPCTGAQSREAYAGVVAGVQAALSGDLTPVVSQLETHLAQLAAAQRYERAAVVRDRAAALVAAVGKTRRLGSLGLVPHLAAARRLPTGGWELHVVRHGRLAAAGTAGRGEHPREVLARLVAVAETVPPPPPPTTAATAEESELVHRWLTDTGARLVAVDGCWAEPVGLPARWVTRTDHGARAVASHASAG
jgi:DNA polymerase-3 subunit epsilon